MSLGFGDISIIGFYLIILLLLYKYRKLVEFHKIYFIYKTKVGIFLMNWLSKFKFWKYWGYAGIPVAFGGMIFILYFLVSKLVTLVQKPETAEKTLQLILPWGSSGSVGPFLFVPFWTFLIAIIILVFVHEGAHGIISLHHKLKLKSTGVGMFLFIPLAFVEPDEEKLEKSPAKVQLSVFAAGPFANLCTAAILLVFFTFILNPFAGSVFDNNGIKIVSLEADQPAVEAGLEVNDIILAVDGQDTLSIDQFKEQMDGVNPGDEIRVLTQTKEVTLTTVANKNNASKSHIGISILQNQEPKQSYGTFLPGVLLYLLNLIYWVVLFNIGIGLFNLLPLGPVDGGRMMKTLLSVLIKDEKKAKIAWVIISLFTLLVLIASFVGSALA